MIVYLEGAPLPRALSLFPPHLVHEWGSMLRRLEGNSQRLAQ